MVLQPLGYGTGALDLESTRGFPMELWIRIRHIPVIFFTTGTMDTLASEVCHVEEIAYDPKVS